MEKAKPANVIILPVLFENNVKAVIELASLDTFSQYLDFFRQLTESIGIVLNTIEANTRTRRTTDAVAIAGWRVESATGRACVRTDDELQDKALLLVKQKNEVEAKNKEVEEARRSLEEKAEQLTLTSKYKSEFLANMSHELRTPLNSLLILAQQLYENTEGNLTEKQIRYAKTIHSCGDDLIQLINDILDLSKIESGFITTNICAVRFFRDHFVCGNYLQTNCRSAAFTLHYRNRYPFAGNYGDRYYSGLNQILKNLLSNSFKFTEKGEVKLKIYDANKNWKPGNPNLDNASGWWPLLSIIRVLVFRSKNRASSSKPSSRLKGTTSRKYGGTGLGLVNQPWFNRTVRRYH